MNAQEEMELHREEGQNLLDQLILLTGRKKIRWECTAYTPMIFFRESRRGQSEQGYITHDWTALAGVAGKHLVICAEELLFLSGQGKTRLTITVLDGKEKEYYTSFSDRSIVRFLDALFPAISDTGIVTSMSERWPSPAEMEEADITAFPVVQACDRLFREHRLLDFHKAVCHPRTRKRILFDFA